MSDLWKLFHRLWGKAHDNPDYVKAEWNDLQREIQKLELPVIRIVNEAPRHLMLKNGIVCTKKELEGDYGR